MIKTAFCSIPFLLLSINPAMAQNKNILECMEVIGFDAYRHVEADLNPKECDTLIDLESGYFELKDVGIDTKVCQVAKFNNFDGTFLVGITGYFADMQCSNHPSQFYEISKSGNSYVLIEKDVILPALDFAMLFTDVKPIQVLEKYLPEIKSTYLNSKATLKDVLEEVYDFHIIIPRKGTTLQITLTVCDYIPRNQVSISAEDWNIIETHIKVIELSYDKIQKRFKLF